MWTHCMYLSTYVFKVSNRVGQTILFCVQSLIGLCVAEGQPAIACIENNGLFTYYIAQGSNGWCAPCEWQTGAQQQGHFHAHLSVCAMCINMHPLCASICVCVHWVQKCARFVQSWGACEICASCVIFSKKKTRFLAHFCSTIFTHTNLNCDCDCDFTLKLLIFYTFS